MVILGRNNSLAKFLGFRFFVNREKKKKINFFLKKEKKDKLDIINVDNKSDFELKGILNLLEYWCFRCHAGIQ